MRDSLDGGAVRRWCAAGLAGLLQCEHEINQLNVYPVPDGDTGTNLVLTLTAAEQALQASDPLPDQAGQALRGMARGALLGARGNSGVIVAQLLRGLADSLATGPGTVRGRDLADALGEAAKASYAAVAEPVEGTILSVASAAARAAAGCDSDQLATVARAAAGAAATALARTPQQLPVLAAAGVVDAGGRGLVVLLDALVEVVAGTPPARPAPEPAAGPAGSRPPIPPHSHPPAAVLHQPGPAGYGHTYTYTYAYEVQFLLAAEDAAVARMRTVLGGLGDSLVVVGTGDGTWHVHVHVDDVGAAIEAGVVAGRPYQISVTRFEETTVPASGRGAVVVASGAGLLDLFGREGAVVVGDRPSTAEVLAAIRATRAGQVVVLPNDPDTQSVTAAAADEAATADVRVAVVPTRSPVQALAALAVRDPQRRFDDDVIAMAEAAGACRHAEVCRAARDALTVAGRCRAGDVLGLVEGEVHLIGDDLTVLSRQLLDRLLGGGGELVSLLVGADAPDRLGPALTAHLAATWPFVEVQLYYGGQPHYELLVGIE
ncbi:MAG: DAK2 domain-containing protein [Micromonosporaceae bacterium]|nr:DAK2 domain-containing protein [Micromonosporaceae bacterium]